MSGVPIRLRWAVDAVDPQPAERLLEVGCGPGVAAGLLCDRLTTGGLLAVDRSATAIARAARRNAEHLATGRLELRQCGLDALEVAPASLDQALAVDVNVFWTAPADAELRLLRAALRPGGRLHLLYGVGPSGPERVTRAIADRLAAARFDDVTVLSSPAGFGVTARRP